MALRSAECLSFGKSAPRLLRKGLRNENSPVVCGDLRRYLDDQLTNEATAATLPALHVVAGRVEAIRETVLKVVNANQTAQDVELQLRGVPGILPQGRAFVLTSNDPGDERFRYTFPGQSLTVLRLQTKPWDVPLSEAIFARKACMKQLGVHS